MPNFIWIGIFCRPRVAKNCNFTGYFNTIQLQQYVVSSASRIETTFRPNVLHYYKPFPIQRRQNFLYSNAFMAKWLHRLCHSSAWRTKITKKTSFFVHFPAACKVRSHKTRRDDTGGRAIIASLPDKQQLIVLATYKAKQLNIRSVAADVEAFLFLDRPCSVVDDLKESIRGGTPCKKV